jgi:hypothetical protein
MSRMFWADHDTHTDVHTEPCMWNWRTHVGCSRIGCDAADMAEICLGGEEWVGGGEGMWCVCKYEYSYRGV